MTTCEKEETLGAIFHDEMSRSNDAIEVAQRTIERLSSQLIRERRLRKQMADDLNAAVVSDPRRPGHWTTLWAIYENEEYRGTCPTCHETACPGCLPNNVTPLDASRLEDLYLEWENRTCTANVPSVVGEAPFTFV